MTRLNIIIGYLIILHRQGFIEAAKPSNSRFWLLTIKLNLFICTYIGCQPTYNKSNGRIQYVDIIRYNKEKCTFTINAGQQNNVTISVYFSKLVTIGNEQSNYLKVLIIFLRDVEFKNIIILTGRWFLLQVYDGPSISSPLIINLNRRTRSGIPSPIFSTGPSLTMSYEIDYPDGDIAFDISYTSTDQGAILLSFRRHCE